MINFGDVPASSVLPIFFSSYNASGASVTLSGLAITDVEIYKGTSMTQRNTDAGVVLLDTDGIDLDGTTGINGFSIDLGDNTDAGFYAVGSFFNVVVSAVTIDLQVVNFVAATFRIRAAETSAGTAKADVSHWLGTAAATPTVAGVPEVDVTHWNGTAVSAPATAGIPDVNVKNIDNDAASASGTVTFPNATLASTTNITSGTLTTVTTATNVTTVNGLAAGVITAAAVATGAIDADAIAADAATEIANAVWDTDATGRQTQGTFGQAIGDPVADTNTIYKAVVTDATGATVGVDVVAVKADTAAILDDTGTSGVIVASLAAGSITAAVIANNAIDAATFAADVDAEILSYIVSDATRLGAANLNTLAGHDPGETIMGATDLGTGAGLTTLSTQASVDAVKSDTAAILVDTGTTLDGKIDTIDTVVDAIKVKTDSLTFTSAGKVDSNLLKINGTTVLGDGSATPWGP